MRVSTCAARLGIRSGQGRDQDVSYPELDGLEEETYPQTNQRGLGIAAHEVIWNG